MEVDEELEYYMDEDLALGLKWEKEVIDERDKDDIDWDDKPSRRREVY